MPSDTKDVQWEFVRGLLENAIYGGRIDNIFDLRVLNSYLEQFFNPKAIAGSQSRSKNVASFPSSITVPKSCSIMVSDVNNVCICKLWKVSIWQEITF